jgi:dsDNA-binding SOS-regulon protein
MAKQRKYQAINDLVDLMETWLGNTQYQLPHLPPDASVLMAEQAFAVITILAAGEDALQEDGMLKDEDDD